MERSRKYVIIILVVLAVIVFSFAYYASLKPGGKPHATIEKIVEAATALFLVIALFQIHEKKEKSGEETSLTFRNGLIVVLLIVLALVLSFFIGTRL